MDVWMDGSVMDVYAHVCMRRGVGFFATARHIGGVLVRDPELGVLLCFLCDVVEPYLAPATQRDMGATDTNTNTNTNTNADTNTNTNTNANAKRPTPTPARSHQHRTNTNTNTPTPAPTHHHQHQKTRSQVHVVPS